MCSGRWLILLCRPENQRIVWCSQKSHVMCTLSTRLRHCDVTLICLFSLLIIRFILCLMRYFVVFVHAYKPWFLHYSDSITSKKPKVWFQFGFIKHKDAFYTRQRWSSAFGGTAFFCPVGVADSWNSKIPAFQPYFWSSLNFFVFLLQHLVYVWLD